MRIRAFLVACLPSSTDKSTSTANGCTEMGCTDDTEPDFTLTIPSTWAFYMDIDGVVVVYAATLPLLEDNPDFRQGDDLRLSLSGSALADAVHAIVGLGIYRTGVTNVALTTLLDGTEQ